MIWGRQARYYNTAQRGRHAHSSNALSAIFIAPSLVLLPARAKREKVSSRSPNGASKLTSNEPSSVNKDTTLDPRNLVELVVPDAPPRLGQRLATLERLGVLGDRLDAPLAGNVGGFGVKDVEGELSFGDRERLLEEVEVLL